MEKQKTALLNKVRNRASNKGPARQGIDKKRETKRKINVKQGMEQVVKEYNKARNKAQ